MITAKAMEERIQHCVKQVSGILDMTDQNRELVALKKK